MECEASFRPLPPWRLPAINFTDPILAAAIHLTSHHPGSASPVPCRRSPPGISSLFLHPDPPSRSASGINIHVGHLRRTSTFLPSVRVVSVMCSSGSAVPHQESGLASLSLNTVGSLSVGVRAVNLYVSVGWSLGDRSIKTRGSQNISKVSISRRIRISFWAVCRWGETIEALILPASRRSFAASHDSGLKIAR
jgi:hypothetical protein